MTPARILIVEDDAIAAKDLVRAIEKLNHTVCAVVNTGEAAIKLAATILPDFIIINASLRGKYPGIETAGAIYDNLKIPAVFITSQSFNNAVERTKHVNPYGFLLKPVNIREVNACIRLVQYRIDTEKRNNQWEERYYRLAEMGKELVYRMSLPSGKYEYVSSSAAELTGYTPEEYYATPLLISRIIHPDWKHYFEVKWQKLLDGEIDEHYEYQIVTRAGETRWFEQRNSLIKDKHGVPVAVEGIVYDVSALRQTEDVIRKQSSEYRAIFDAIPAMVVLKDMNNKIIRANKRCAAYFNSKTGDIEGKYLDELYPNQAEQYLEQDRKIAQTGEPMLGIIERFEDKTGNVSWLTHDKYPFRNSRGEITGIIVMSRDITSEKVTEKALLESETRYRNLVQNAPIALTRYKPGKRIFEFANKEMLRQAGFSLDELNNMSDEEFNRQIHEDDRDNILAEYSEWGKGGFKGVKQLLYRLVNRDNRILWLDTYHYADFKDDGTVDAINQIYIDITDRKLTEDALKKSELQYKELTQNAPVGVARLDLARKKYDFFNEEFQRQVGYTMDEINSLEKDVLDSMIYREDKARVHEEYRHWRKKGAPGVKYIEYRIVNRQKQVLWLNTYTYAGFDDKGKIESIYEVCIDATERKATDEALQLSEMKFRAVSESVRAQIVIFQDEKFVYVNPYSEVITGYPEAELLSLNFWELVHPDYKEAVRQRGLARQKGDPAPEEYEMKIITKSGETKWLFYSAVIIEYLHKPAVLGIAFDISERKHYEEVLKNSEERYRAFIDQSNEGIFRIEMLSPVSTVLSLNEQADIITKFGYVAECNGVFARMLGFEKREDIIGRRIHELLLKTDASYGDIIRKFLENDYRMENLETSEIIENRGQMFFLTNAAGIVENGMLLRVWGTRQDISEEKKAEDLLIKSLNEKDILLKEIHHRVKNNLQIVSSLLKLQSQYVKDKGVAELFNESRNRVHSMSIIHQKLYQSKNISSINFGEYISMLGSHLLQSFGLNPEHYKVIVEAGNIVMNLDNAIPSGLMINELITNSLKHAFDDSRTDCRINVYVSYDQDISAYKVVVRDNGRGIPNDFDIKKSSSFGLKLVSTLVEQMNGSISYDRQNGTIFTIFFKGAEYKERS